LEDTSEFFSIQSPQTSNFRRHLRLST
jgi:hypothetical protein